MFTILEEHQLCFKEAKCELLRSRLEVLGLVLSEGHIDMDPVKVTSMADWPTPLTLTKAQSFLSFCNVLPKSPSSLAMSACSW